MLALQKCPCCCCQESLWAVIVTPAPVSHADFTQVLAKTHPSWLPLCALHIKEMSTGGCCACSTRVMVCNHFKKQCYESLWESFWRSTCAWIMFELCVWQWLFLRGKDSVIYRSFLWISERLLFLKSTSHAAPCYNPPWISADPSCEVAHCLLHLSIAAFQMGLMTLLMVTLAFVFLFYTDKGRVR